MCTSCFFLNLKLSLHNCNADKKRRIFAQSSAACVWTIIKYFLQPLCEFAQTLKNAVPKISFWHSVVSLIFQIDKGGNLVYD